MKAQNEILFEISLSTQPSLITELNLQLAADFIQKQTVSSYDDESKSLYCYEYMGNCKPTQEKINELKDKFKQTYEKVCFESFLLQPEAVKCLQIVQTEIAKLVQFNLNEQELQKFSFFSDYFSNSLPYDFNIPAQCLFHVV